MPKQEKKKHLSEGIVVITTTFNNTFVALQTPSGDLLQGGLVTPGALGYKNARKSVPFVAQEAAAKVALQAEQHKIKRVKIKVKGPGAGRESAIRAINNSQLIVTSIEDITPLPHNGCRPRKKRRV